jgi:hypothetical protein
MKKATPLFLLIAIAILFTACPFQSQYAIDETPLLSIDENLLGSWATMVNKPSSNESNKEAPVKIIFFKKTDVEYDIKLTGYITELKGYVPIINDTISATGFLSKVEEITFLNVQINNANLIAQIKFEKKYLSILFLKDGFTPRFIKSPADVKKAILYHYKTVAQPFYDDWIVLKNLQRVK